MSSKFGLFECIGFEVEYQLVNRDTLDVWAQSDAVLRNDSDEIEAEVEKGVFSWSNELVAHLIELKTTQPVPSLLHIEQELYTQVQDLNALLAEHNACLMPTGSHPWMNPRSETVIWQHEGREIYHTFDAIFDCRTHGWANAQSIHVNLPFCGTKEFESLHAAARIVLPLLPALAASTPVREGRITNTMDTRLISYAQHTERVPFLVAEVIPEAIFSIEQYQAEILNGIYASLERVDPEGILKYEWANARGAIARFDRNSIELRLLDSQECPKADIAVASFVIAMMRLLVEETSSALSKQKAFATERLRAILDDTTSNA